MGEGAEPTPGDLRLARGIAGDRFNHLYGEAMVGWNSSIGEIERTRTTRGDEVQIITHSFGDCRYLLAAAKLVMLHAALPTQGIIAEGWAKAADALEAAGVPIDEIEPPPRQAENFSQADGEDPTWREPPAHAYPSEEDCSAPSAEIADPSPPVPPLRDIKAMLTKRLVERERNKRAARSEFFAPVQAPPLGELAQSVLQGPQQAKTKASKAPPSKRDSRTADLVAS